MIKHVASTNIIDAITSAHFIADAAMVERLAATVVEGASADATYLRVLLAHMQARLGRPVRRRTASADMEAAGHVLETVHGELYPAVLRGVGPEDLPITERNRRATFARSAASTVRYYVREGGDIRQLDVATVTKAGLRKLVQSQQEGEAAPTDETRPQKSFRKATDVLVKAAQYLLARGDPEDAQQRIEAAIQTLEELLDKWLAPAHEQPDVGATTTTIIRPGARGSGGAQAPLLHRGG